METLSGFQKVRVSTALKWQKTQKMWGSTHRHNPTHTHHTKVFYRTQFSATAMAQNISISQRHYLNQVTNDCTIKSSANSHTLLLCVWILSKKAPSGWLQDLFWFTEADQIWPRSLHIIPDLQDLTQNTALEDDLIKLINCHLTLLCQKSMYSPINYFLRKEVLASGQRIPGLCLIMTKGSHSLFRAGHYF